MSLILFMDDYYNPNSSISYSPLPCSQQCFFPSSPSLRKVCSNRWCICTSLRSWHRWSSSKSLKWQWKHTAMSLTSVCCRLSGPVLLAMVVSVSVRRTEGVRSSGKRITANPEMSHFPLGLRRRMKALFESVIPANMQMRSPGRISYDPGPPPQATPVMLFAPINDV